MAECAMTISIMQREVGATWHSNESQSLEGVHLTRELIGTQLCFGLMDALGLCVPSRLACLAWGEFKVHMHVFMLLREL